MSASWRDWTRDPHEWMPEFRLVIEAIGKALNSRRPTPELLWSLADEYINTIPGHKIAIERERQARAGRNRYKYVLRISGDRFSGSWVLTNAQLRDTVNAVYPDFPIRSS